MSCWHCSHDPKTLIAPIPRIDLKRRLARREARPAVPGAHRRAAGRFVRHAHAAARAARRPPGRAAPGSGRAGPAGEADAADTPDDGILPRRFIAPAFIARRFIARRFIARRFIAGRVGSGRILDDDAEAGPLPRRARRPAGDRR
jgi:hypothetical protein